MSQRMILRRSVTELGILAYLKGIAAVLPKDATLFGQRLWDTAPLRPLASVEPWPSACSPREPET